VYEIIKRISDIVLAFFMLLIMIPLFILVALVLMITQGTPVIYRQIRAGKDGQPFTMYKFRTMYEGDVEKHDHLPVQKIHGDPRVTPAGKFLRASHIDELPQLLNVLCGDMSIVGPRPLPVEDLQRPGWREMVTPEENEKRMEWQKTRESVLPGLTGLWQISDRPELEFENWIKCDTEYVQKKSCLLDFMIIMKTIPAIILNKRKSK
jgi:lipopolysaccharide/colanic/teichoic acid biosynthesis glycosyltransferase